MSNTERQPADSRLLTIFGVTLISVLGVSSITPAFPLISRELAVSPAQVAGLITAFTLPGVLLTPIIGILADRIGRKTILVPTLLLFAVAGAACAFVQDLRLLLILRFFQGIGAAGPGSLNAALIADLYHGRKRAAAMGYNSSVLSVGTASYPAIGGAIAVIGWNWPFLLTLTAIPVALAVHRLLPDTRTQGELHLGQYLNGVWQSLRSWRAAGLFTMTLLSFIILYGAYMSYFGFLMNDRFDTSSATVGLFMASHSLSSAAISMSLGYLNQRLTPGVIVRLGAGFYVVSMLLMPNMPTLLALLLPAMLYGFGQGLYLPTLLTQIADLAPEEQRAAFMSANTMVLRLGQTLGPLIMGALFVTVGFQGVFMAAAAVGLAAGLLSLLLIQ